MSPRHRLLGLVSALAVAAAGAVRAADPPADVPDAATLVRDRQVVTEILAAEQIRGFDAARDRMPELQAILAHAPTPFSPVEERAGTVYIREARPEACLAAMLSFAARKTPARQKRAICVDNPYPDAALLIASYLDDIGRPEEGLAMLDRGLAFDPQSPVLVAEKGAALNMLHRAAEAVAVYKAGIAEIPILDDWQRGMMLRGEGFALVELKRYDEAAQAYKDSLKIDPNHGHAAQELNYIARVSAGGSTTALTFDAAVPPSTPPK
jgi:tetratricopeptide (TPR) repeat protein